MAGNGQPLRFCFERQRQRKIISVVSLSTYQVSKMRSQVINVFYYYSLLLAKHFGKDLQDGEMEKEFQEMLRHQRLS